MEERQFHCVCDVLDLGAQPPDVVVTHVGNLFHEEVFEVVSAQLLNHEFRARLDDNDVARSELLTSKRAREFKDTIIVAPK